MKIAISKIEKLFNKDTVMSIIIDFHENGDVSHLELDKFPLVGGDEPPEIMYD